MCYLNEERLGEYLLQLFPGTLIVHDQIVPNSYCRFRPDYRIEAEKLIIEFDGFSHYTTFKVINNDTYKDIIFSEMGYTIIRIPYFIQLDEMICKKLFNRKLLEYSVYPHGFIDSKVMLPTDFSFVGGIRFLNDLIKFSEVFIDIQKSLIHKRNTCKEDLDMAILPHFLLPLFYIKTKEELIQLRASL